MNKKEFKKRLTAIRRAGKNELMWAKIRGNLEEVLVADCCPYKPGDTVTWQENSFRKRQRRGVVRCIELPSKASSECRWRMTVVPYSVRRPSELIRDFNFFARFVEGYGSAAKGGSLRKEEPGA